ncbi:substrate-binding domain-containing protein [Microlunatus sp. Y2014]|uniref:LacI family DNA-binding transcriptional regulator n=1 Tax=Microlunatus sp. Y2014 TaxID=3418488 RepID=UPI003DA6FEC5
MLKEERHQRIVRALQQGGSVKVSDLASLLQSSRATIWRDIDELARRGTVSKVHGGATLVERARDRAGVERSLEFMTPQPGLVLGLQAPESLYYYGPIIAGARRACELAGARLVLSISGYQSADVREAVDTLLDTEVDGMLLTPTVGHDGPDDTWSWVGRLRRPIVLVEREYRGLELPGVRSVSTAHEAGVHAALWHLQQLGHRRIGLVSVHDRTDPMRRVVEGWRMAVRDLGLNTDSDTDLAWIDREPGEAAAELLAAGVTGLLCMNDAMAARVLRALRALGVRVPGDVSLISYDDEMAEHLKPPLTAVSPAREAVGFVAAQQLLTLLSTDDPGPGRRIRIDPRLVVRESTGPAPAPR